MHSETETLPRRLTSRAEASPALDQLAQTLEPVADALAGSPRVRSLLRGEPLGHALHPVLTDLPIGLWVSSTVLDLVGPDDGRSADRLLGLGILAAAPTALTGLADWRRGGDRVRSVGALHAAANSTALALYSGSWLLRRRRRRGAGIALSLLAGAFTGVGGYLGGHMILVLGSPGEQADGAPDRRADDASQGDAS